MTKTPTQAPSPTAWQDVEVEIERALRSQFRQQLGLNIIDDRIPTGHGSIWIDIPALAKAAIAIIKELGGDNGKAN